MIGERALEFKCSKKNAVEILGRDKQPLTVIGAP